MSIGIVINPEAGPSNDVSVLSRRQLAYDALRAAAVDGEVRLTEGPGSARSIATEMVVAGVSTVVAWGGDGTINEVAAAVAPADVTLGVVPGGSGNGFARGLGLNHQPPEALKIAITGTERRIDTGDVDGKLFVNVAGVGFDAHLADVFNRLRVRGSSVYIRTGIRELLAYRALTYTIAVGEDAFTTQAFLVAIANGREYGTGAVIAPRARVDDGVLDCICIPHRSLPSVLWHARRLFTGTLDQVPGVRSVSSSTLTITSDHPLTFHVDGEVYAGPAQLHVAIRPRSLKVRVPTQTN
jgi:YegS/Rv2252/BmrU family lipid kinase